MYGRIKTKLLACTTFFCLSFSAHGATFFFSQTGYSGGGTISGSFEAVDVDHNGQINSFYGEVSAFSVSFSGDSLVQDFTQGLSDLYGLVYDINSGFLGDRVGGRGEFSEGMTTNYLLGAKGISFKSGLGPLGSMGGEVTDNASGFTSTTPELIVVAAPVPAPAANFLYTSALFGFFCLRNKLSERSKEHLTDSSNTP